MERRYITERLERAIRKATLSTVPQLHPRPSLHRKMQAEVARVGYRTTERLSPECQAYCDRFCIACGCDSVGNDPHQPGCWIEAANAEADAMERRYREDEQEFCEICGVWCEDGGHDEALHTAAFPF